MSEEFNPFAAGEILRLCSTTGPQQEVITSAQFNDEANTAFNEAVSIRIDGPVDIALLTQCWETLVDRHEMLRSTFSRNGQEICLQSSLRPTLRFDDWTGQSEEQRARSLDELWRNIAVSPMNLEEGPLTFVWLLRLDDQRHELVIAAHHLILDGWSFGLLLNELVALYKNGGNVGGLPQAQSFFEFAQESELEQFQNEDIDFWRDQFKVQPPALDLPLDFVRPRQRTFSARRYDFHVNAELVTSLPKAAAKLKASLVHTVLSGYFVLLQRLTGAEDIVVGLPVAGQVSTKRHNQLGHMVQLLPIRVQFDSDTPFADVVKLVRNRVLEASEHPNFTFGKLVEGMRLDRSRVPLIATIFNIDQPMGKLDFGTCKGTLRTIPRAAENFELFLNILHDPGQLTIEATFSTTLFAEETVVSWLYALESILEEAINAPETKVGDFALSRKLSHVQSEANQTTVEITSPDFVHAFRKQVSATPDAVAVVASNQPLTYRQLDERSNALAAALVERNIREGAVVGVCCERNADMLTSVIAILKLGAAYLPLDPDFPAERLMYMLEDSGAAAVIEDDAAPAAVKNAAAVTHLSLSTLSELAPVGEFALPAPHPQRLAYVIYTSGSTGKPKGVRIPARAMINFLESMVREPGCHAGDTLLAVTTLSFDMSVLELFVPLITGACVVIASRTEAKDGERLFSLIKQNDVNIFQATPAMWRVILTSGWRDAAATTRPLRAVSGGEPLPPDLVSELLPRVGELWNGFGPTETTVYSTCKRITNTIELITIGKPIGNTQVYVVDRRSQVLPIGVPGELCIGGTGVTLGYHNRPELTDERFVELPGLGRVYRTGDLAKQLPNGELQHLGRIDDQVKLRGYRIELGEIEAALKACETVQAAAVYLWEVGPQDVRLVACCVPSKGQELNTSSIRKSLRETLPAYMVPQYIQALDTIPLTPSGKVNRRALPRPELSETKILSKAELRGPSEELIAEIWTALLKPKNPIGRDDNFFEIGGHSLLALEAIRRIEKESGTRLTPTQLVSERLGQLAEKFGASKLEVTGGGPVALSSAESRTLSLEQARILRRHLDYPSTVCGNLPAAWVISGSLDVPVFVRSLQRVMERQTALRTVIQGTEGAYKQVVVHHQELKLPEFIDLRGEPNAMERAIDQANQLAAHPFQVVGQLLVRAKLYQTQDEEFLFVLVPHQLVFDGWSFDLLIGELAQTYSALKNNDIPAFPKLPFEFRDYAHWMAKREPEAGALAFHRRSLPSQSDAASARGKGDRVAWNFDQDALARIEAYCERNQLRLHEYFFSAFLAGLAVWRDQQKVTVAFPVTGRYNSEVIGLIGSFVSALPCELTLTGDTFLTQAKNLSSQIKTFLEHQDLTLAELLSGSSLANQSFHSFMEASLSFQDVRNRPTKLADLGLRQVALPREQTEQALELWVRVEADGVAAVVDFDSSKTSAAQLAPLGELISASMNGYPEKATVLVTNVPQPTVEEPSKKPLWRRLFS